MGRKEIEFCGESEVFSWGTPIELFRQEVPPQKIELVKEVRRREQELRKEWEGEKQPLSAFLSSKTEEFRVRLRGGETLEDLLPEAFASASVALERRVGLRPYDVQILGAIALAQENIAHILTGEGKTLVAVFPLYLYALEGKGTWLVTANDYLAQRDADWMGPAFSALGLSVGVVTEGEGFVFDPDFGGDFHLRPVPKSEVYKSDVVYLSPRAAIFDYLRDGTAQRPEDIVQGQELPSLVVVDEVDEVFFDQAPHRYILVSSQERDEKEEELWREIARRMKEKLQDSHFRFEKEFRGEPYYVLSEEGIEFWEKEAEEMVKKSEVDKDVVFSLLQIYLTALKELKRGRDYIIEGGKIVLVDPTSGRRLLGHRLQGGLHSALEAKEDLEFTPLEEVWAETTTLSFFNRFSRWAGMSGTAVEAKDWFESFCGKKVEVIPPNKPVQRVDHPPEVFLSQEEKWQAVVAKIISLSNRGQPVLVGCAFPAEAEWVERQLRENIRRLRSTGKLPKDFDPEIQVLTAKNDRKEAELIAKAGWKGVITVSTQISGRGVDIKLDPDARKAGGLVVVNCVPWPSQRQFHQLVGRAGRQGDPGESFSFYAVDDRLVCNFAPEKLKSVSSKKKPSEIIETARKIAIGWRSDVLRTLFQEGWVLDGYYQDFRKRRMGLLRKGNWRELQEMDQNWRNFLIDFEDLIETVRFGGCPRENYLQELVLRTKETYQKSFGKGQGI